MKTDTDLAVAKSSNSGDDTIRRLGEIWQRLLGVPSIGSDQNYFDLGGDSSLAVHLFAEIENVFQIKLPLATLFEAQTLRELAEVINRHVPVFELSAPTAVPGDETARAPAEIGQRVLGAAQITRDQNYFHFGGDSSRGAHLVAEKLLDLNLPLTTLFEAQTLGEGEVARSQDSALPVSLSSLVTIQGAGSRPPFFCMHGAGGEVLIYRNLARLLGTDQPFYALQAKGLDGSCPPLTRIEDMAAAYVKEIQAVQPHGPYFVGGYCGGGTISYEVAQQLRAKGEEIALLALFDTSNFSKVAAPSALTKLYYGIERVIFHAANILSLDFAGMRKFLSDKMKQLHNRIPVWRGMLQARYSKSSSEGSRARILGQLWAANDRACSSYTPQPYAGTITDFRPKGQYRMLTKPGIKWDALALGGQQVVILPVYPAGMLIEPFVKHLATALSKVMDEAIRCSEKAATAAGVVVEHR